MVPLNAYIVFFITLLYLYCGKLRKWEKKDLQFYVPIYIMINFKISSFIVVKVGRIITRLQYIQR